jgi:hypothetical protein
MSKWCSEMRETDSIDRQRMREWLETTRKAKPIPVKRSGAQILRNLRNKRSQRKIPGDPAA